MATGRTERLLDASAIGLSSLCLTHCLLLPILAALLPMFGAWADAEWAHVAFVLMAAPVSGLVLLSPRAGGRRTSWPMIILAAMGLALLADGALWAPHTVEIPITVAGSLTLVGVHVWNWRRRSHDCRQAGVSPVSRTLLGEG